MSGTYTTEGYITDTGNLLVEVYSKYCYRHLKPDDYEVVEVLERYEPNQKPLQTKAGSYVEMRAVVEVEMPEFWSPISCPYHIVDNGNVFCIYNKASSPDSLEGDYGIYPLMCLYHKMYTGIPQKPLWDYEEAVLALVKYSDCSGYSNVVDIAIRTLSELDAGLEDVLREMTWYISGLKREVKDKEREIERLRNLLEGEQNAKG